MWGNFCQAEAKQYGDRRGGKGEGDWEGGGKGLIRRSRQMIQGFVSAVTG